MFDVPEVLEVQLVPSDEVKIVPELTTTTKDESTSKEVIVSVLLTFPAASVTVIVQFE
jgi:hypothetical protein